MPVPGDRSGRRAGAGTRLRDLRQRRAWPRRQHGPPHSAAGDGTRGGGRSRGGRRRTCSDMKAGDRVTFDSTVYCGRCVFCRRGEQNLCDNRQVLGVRRDLPAPRRVRRVRVRTAPHHVPAAGRNLSFEQAAMIEAVSVAVHAVDLTPVQLGDTAVVVGCGMIGLLTIQAAKRAGCSRIFAVDIDEAQAAIAREGGRRRTRSIPKRRMRRRRSARSPEAAARTWRSKCVGATEPISHRHRQRAQGRSGDAGGQCVAQDRAAAAVGSLAADPAAGLLRIEWGVPGVHRDDVARRDRGGYR